MNKDIEENIKLSFEYDPITGILWRIRKRCPWEGYKKVKEKAGTNSHGYLSTRFMGKGFFNHRIAWFLQTGSFPPPMMDIDHINRNKLDNRWSNLRLAGRGQNNMNSGKSKRNTTGEKGVHPTRGRWFSRITVEGKIIHLGVFKNFDDAVSARKAAEIKYFGEYARVK